MLELACGVNMDVLVLGYSAMAGGRLSLVLILIVWALSWLYVGLVHCVLLGFECHLIDH